MGGAQRGVAAHDLGEGPAEERRIELAPEPEGWRRAWSRGPPLPPGARGTRGAPGTRREGGAPGRGPGLPLRLRRRAGRWHPAGRAGSSRRRGRLGGLRRAEQAIEGGPRPEVRFGIPPIESTPGSGKGTVEARTPARPGSFSHRRPVLGEGGGGRRRGAWPPRRRSRPVQAADQLLEILGSDRRRRRSASSTATAMAATAGLEEHRQGQVHVERLPDPRHHLDGEQRSARRARRSRRGPPPAPGPGPPARRRPGPPRSRCAAGRRGGRGSAAHGCRRAPGGPGPSSPRAAALRAGARPGPGGAGSGGCQIVGRSTATRAPSAPAAATARSAKASAPSSGVGAPASSARAGGSRRPGGAPPSRRPCPPRARRPSRRPGSACGPAAPGGPGEGVEEGVGGAVADLARAAQDGRQGGEEDEEGGGSAPPPARRGRWPGGGRRRSLGAITSSARSRLSELQGAAAREAGRVHGGVDPAEALHRRRHRPVGALGGGDVGRHHQDLRAGGFEGEHGLDPAPVAPCLCRLRPPATRRGPAGRSARQRNEARRSAVGREVAREAPRDRQTEASQATGDEVDGARAKQAGAPRGRRAAMPAAAANGDPSPATGSSAGAPRQGGDGLALVLPAASRSSNSASMRRRQATADSRTAVPGRGATSRARRKAGMSPAGVSRRGRVRRGLGQVTRSRNQIRSWNGDRGSGPPSRGARGIGMERGLPGPRAASTAAARVGQRRGSRDEPAPGEARPPGPR